MNDPRAQDPAYGGPKQEGSGGYQEPADPHTQDPKHRGSDDPSGRKPKYPDRPDDRDSDDDRPNGSGPGAPGDGSNGSGNGRRPRGEILDPCRTRPATPFLVIRSWPEDLGVRPIPAGDDVNLTFSPDIPFVPETFDDGSFSLRAWVTNVGLAPAAPTQIEFFLVPPSISQPFASPLLVATEYAVIEPQTSKLITSRRLNFPAPFAGGLAQGVIARCSTPFDRNSDTLDPALDRHVGLVNAWPIIDQAPSVDLAITNWFDAPAEGRVEIAIERLRLTGGGARTSSKVRQTFPEHDLLNFGGASPDIDRHLQELRRDRRISATHTRTIRRALSGRTAPKNVGVERVSTGAAPNQVDLDLEILEVRRKIFPATQDVRAFAGKRSLSAAHAGCGLPQGRRVLIDRLEFDALEERKIRLSVRPIRPLRRNEFIIVHLFHLAAHGGAFLGRIGLIVGFDAERLSRKTP